jgi:hypothetical protein
VVVSKGWARFHHECVFDFVTRQLQGRLTGRRSRVTTDNLSLKPRANRTWEDRERLRSSEERIEENITGSTRFRKPRVDGRCQGVLAGAEASDEADANATRAKRWE